MIRRTLLAAMICAIVLTTGALRAEPTTSPEPAPSHKQAALDLLASMHMDTVLADAIDSMLDLQMKQNPDMVQFKPAMQEFFKKYMSWDSLKDDMARLYCDEFSESELKELTAFYKSPVGQKMAAKQSVLMTKGAQLGQRKVQEHLPELQQAIQAQMDKKDKGAQSSSSP